MTQLEEMYRTFRNGDPVITVTQSEKCLKEMYAESGLRSKSGSSDLTPVKGYRAVAISLVKNQGS